MTATTTEHVADLPRFGRYAATAELGAGAMGAVYRAYDDRLRRQVAIKTMRTVRAGDELVERFFREARAVGALAHPNIIAVYDVDVAEGTPFLVLELAAGGSLKQRLAGGPLDPVTVRAVGIQIAQALAAAHEQGILHRDVKPANILETEPGTFKLADFGIAHVPDSTLTVTGMFLGSPAYAAPESISHGTFTPASDVYGLGATLYELLTGERAGSGCPPVTSELGTAITRALSPDPAARPSAAGFARALSTSAAPHPTPAPFVAAAASMSMIGVRGDPGAARRRRLIAIAVGALLGLVVVGAIAATAGDPAPPQTAPPPTEPAWPHAGALDEADPVDAGWVDDDRGRGKGRGKKKHKWR